MKKRSDECLFCHSRSCFSKIYRHEEPTYDEIACRKHTNDLANHCDNTLGVDNGIIRNHISSTGKLSRKLNKYPICKFCDESDCNIYNDGSCSMIRNYKKYKELVENEKEI